MKCRCSSVVEHVIGNDGVVSPILISGTINKKASLKGAFLLIHIGDRKRTYGGVKSGAEVAEPFKCEADEADNEQTFFANCHSTSAAPFLKRHSRECLFTLIGLLLTKSDFLVFES